MVINQLLGHSIEALVLRPLDQNARYDFLSGKTPTERRAELSQEYASFKDLGNTLPAVYWNLTETEMVAYHDRVKDYGEIEALHWLQQHLGTNAPGPSR